MNVLHLHNFSVFYLCLFQLGLQVYLFLLHLTHLKKYVVI